MRTVAKLNELSHTVIGAAIEIHRRVGPGCLESAYTPCLALELARRRLDFRREVALTLRYDELVIPRAYFADFIVDECVVVEVKAVAIPLNAIGGSCRHIWRLPAAHSD